MCGIAGYAGFELPQEERLPLLQRMCAAIVHRGPDDHGYVTDDGAGLGMRRLSIIDLAGGHQPMATDDGRLHLVYNGEIYNYRELRRTLEQEGQRFATTSDTEVLLRLLQARGTAGVAQLNGMFAFALWDREQGRLLLARDRMGIKPLYYYWDGRRLLFASEIKALLASGQVPARLNLQAVWDYLTFRYVPAPQTIWRDVYKLPPAHLLEFGRGAAPRLRRYWEIPYREGPIAGDDAQFDREFSELFTDAVRMRLVADVPVGVMLSGGLDSSAVAAAAIRPDGPPLNTFSVSFDESPATDERPYARRVAAHLGTLHHEVVIGQQDFTGLLPEFVRMTDEPLADLASIPLYCVSKLAREHVKVVLSGEGSDEILGGYEFELLVQAWGRKSRVRRLWERLRRRDEEPMLNMTNYLSSEEKERLFGGGVRFPDSMAPLRADLRHLGSRDRLHQVLYTFCQSWLVEDLLMKADKMSMANSLELRTPFLDYRLVEWAARCPSWIKVGPNGNGELVTKRILRRFARSRLPAEILARPKQGFPVPVYDWLSGSLQSWAADLLTGPEGRLQHLFDPRAVRRSLALGSAPAGGLLDRHRLWNLLILELWMRAWKPQIDASWPSHG